MNKVVVLFTKPFGAYAKGDRAGFDAEAARRLRDLGVVKSDAEAEDAQADAADESPLPDSEQAAPVDVEQSKPAGKAPKGVKT